METFGLGGGRFVFCGDRSVTHMVGSSLWFLLFGLFAALCYNYVTIFMMERQDELRENRCLPSYCYYVDIYLVK